MSRPQPNRSAEEPSRRKRVIYVTGVAVLLLLAAIVSQVSFDLNFLRPDSNQQIVVFASLELLIFLLFVALTFVLVRNLLKLFAERRLGVLGSKFRTRLVVVSLLLSFLPVIVMFWFAYGLMNHSLDKWFSSPVEEVRRDTAAMAALISNLCGAERACGGGFAGGGSRNRVCLFRTQLFLGGECLSPPRPYLAGRIRGGDFGWRCRG